MQEQKDVLLTADIGGTNCRFSLWQANIKADVVYDEVFTKVNHSSFLIRESGSKRFMLKQDFDECIAWLTCHCAVSAKPLPRSTCECNTCNLRWYFALPKC